MTSVKKKKKKQSTILSGKAQILMQFNETREDTSGGSFLFALWCLMSTQTGKVDESIVTGFFSIYHLLTDLLKFPNFINQKAGLNP